MMDVAVLNDARDDLARRLGDMRISHITDHRTDADVAAKEWLLEMESLWGDQLTVLEGNIEFYVDVGAGCPQNSAGIEIAIEFYILSLSEWRQFGRRRGKSEQCAPDEGPPSSDSRPI
jgi:hypothetical protein